MVTGTPYLALAIAVFSLFAKRAFDMRKEKKFREFWGYLALSMVPLCAISLYWAAYGDSFDMGRNVILGMIGAISGAALLIWLGYVVHDATAIAQTPNSQVPESSKEGNNTATSSGQQGGITAGAIIINPPKQSIQQKNEVINQIALLMNEGDSINQTFLDKGDTELIKQQYKSWADMTYAYLYKNLGISYAVQFKNAHGNAWMGMPSGRSVEGGGYLQEIKGKNLTLNDFISELRRD
jgi:hypothetical protein